jgi:4-hydroxy-2-oxoheptanedioate aldolase
MRLKQMAQTRDIKLGHYVGEFATPGIGHILKVAGCDFVFFDMEHSGYSFETLRGRRRCPDRQSCDLAKRHAGAGL